MVINVDDEKVRAWRCCFGFTSAEREPFDGREAKKRHGERRYENTLISIRIETQRDQLSKVKRSHQGWENLRSVPFLVNPDRTIAYWYWRSWRCPFRIDIDFLSPSENHKASHSDKTNKSGARLPPNQGKA